MVLQHGPPHFRTVSILIVLKNMVQTNLPNDIQTQKESMFFKMVLLLRLLTCHLGFLYFPQSQEIGEYQAIILIKCYYYYRICNVMKKTAQNTELRQKSCFFPNLDICGLKVSRFFRTLKKHFKKWWHPPTTTTLYVRGLSKYLEPQRRQRQLDMRCLQALQMQASPNNCEIPFNSVAFAIESCQFQNISFHI